ncbi:3135_t:CDS:2, partial [Acaulospora morrowiae]
NDSLDKITTSNVITQQWNCFKIQTEQEDLDCLMKILKGIENEIMDKERKQHIRSLQNINQPNNSDYNGNELLSLKDMGFLRGKFEEKTNYKDLALNNIALLKNKIKKKDTSLHEHIFTKLSNIDVDKLSNDDPLYIGVIDLGSNKYSIAESDYETLVRNDIQNLRKFVLPSRDVVMHDQWVEDNYIKERIASGIIDILLQEIKLN